MNTAVAFDTDRHEPGTPAARGACSHHAGVDESPAPDCAGEAVVSFVDDEGEWQSGCSTALEQLVEQGRIEPLGQGA